MVDMGKCCSGPSKGGPAVPAVGSVVSSQASAPSGIALCYREGAPSTVTALFLGVEGHRGSSHFSPLWDNCDRPYVLQSSPGGPSFGEPVFLSSPPTTAILTTGVDY